ncbi:complement decay-accelerating factor isoform X3 [Tachyglossus aculeatus]|uniref:complement decay-accelerating factor isoform X3 n=1 Tax=Tachyglossus aculeatus TaxID=9261 RepID=UPI0018F5BF70|nr:complement decay-accelerating factor isoform X3 [Tachyglossus aculeatus]
MSPNAPRLPPLLLLLLPPLLLLPLPPAARGDCPEPPEIPNAHPLLPDPPEFPTGTSLTYSCNKGFVKIPEKSNSVVCLENDQWSASTEFCNRSCDVPPTLRFASLKSEYRTQNYFPVSSVVEYECRPGYKRDLSLSPNLTCLENLLWSKVPDFCIRKQCPSPPDLPNGQVHITDILFGSVILFSCNEGYKLIGEHSSTCELVDQTLAWSNSHPDCAPILCPSPPNIANGSWQRNENDEYPAGASVPYACNRGFSLVGNRDLVCGNDGNWSSPPPECKVVSCENPVVQDGVLENPSKPPYSYETTLIFSCKPGFTLEGSAKITCDSNSKWTPDPPKCLKKATLCPPPQNIANGAWQRNGSEELVAGASVFYTCDSGFSLIGNRDLVCGSDGTWNGPPPECKATLCPPPQNISNGAWQRNGSEELVAGVSVSYTCERGFSLSGNRDLVCGSDGTWSGPPPECKATLCPPPQNVSNGAWQRNGSEELVAGASVFYTCERGFLLTGNRDLVCGSDGTWSGPPPECKGFCENPVVKNGHVVEQSSPPPYLYQATLRFNCSAGFTMEGNPRIRCENGNWIPPPPLCRSSSTISSGSGSKRSNSPPQVPACQKLLSRTFLRFSHPGSIQRRWPCRIFQLWQPCRSFHRWPPPGSSQRWPPPSSSQRWPCYCPSQRRPCYCPSQRRPSSRRRPCYCPSQRRPCYCPSQG